MDKSTKGWFEGMAMIAYSEPLYRAMALSSERMIRNRYHHREGGREGASNPGLTMAAWKQIAVRNS